MKLGKVFLVIIVLVPMAFGSKAQQDPQWTLLNDENSLINPSTMVNDYRLNAQARYRNQWAGLDGSPSTVGFNVSGRVDSAWSAFGLSGQWNSLGAEQSVSFLVNYAFDGKIGEHHIIPGVQLGFMFKELDGTNLNPIQGGDPNIPDTISSDYVFDMGLSIAYRFRGISVGFSAKHLTEGNLELQTTSPAQIYTVSRGYYAHLSYEIGVGRYFRVKPIAFFQFTSTLRQFESMVWFGPRNLSKYFDGISAGVGYRLKEAVMFAAELRFPWFSIGYSYDYATSDLSQYSSGSHELFLRMHIFRNPNSIRNWG